MDQLIIPLAVYLRESFIKYFEVYFALIAMTYIYTSGIPREIPFLLICCSFIVFLKMAISDLTFHEISLCQVFLLLVLVLGYRVSMDDSFLTLIMRLILAGSFFWMQQQLFTQKNIGTGTRLEADYKGVAYIPFFAVALLLAVLLNVAKYYSNNVYFFSALFSGFSYFDWVLSLYADTIFGFIPIAFFVCIGLIKMFLNRRFAKSQASMGTGDVLFLSIMFLMFEPSYFFAIYLCSLLLMLFDSLVVQKGVSVNVQQNFQKAGNI
ncbi:hypothetical protein NZ47_07330 [Anaerovibrio lipolyticus]|uniref:Uncharacterized protein n=1 Tax=Anaerovibrio lipolyticus TaxID=82374 RepID=A0A0B2JZ23_9FIRM|nr:hypothetical protein [Anaerovibrio lipolyticus]KHM52003.1 hypothetical protein NZ47_07330 [Anaerovibrio lipolyticus]